MKEFKEEIGILAPLYRSNIDTDAILPKEYLKRINKVGFGEFLFDDWRYLPETRQANPEFILNQLPEAKFILAGHNFGCGSSREHAVWALDDFGIRAVLAPSFGDIFYSNCFKNGVLPAIINEADADEIYFLSQNNPQEIRINLAQQIIEIVGKRFPFQIDEFRKQTLLLGLDEIAQTLQFKDEILAFEALHQQRFPWLYPEKKKGQK